MRALRLLEAPGTDGHNGEAFACAYSNDGASVLSGGWDGQLRLWDAVTGAHLLALPASPKALSCCAFTPDGKQWLAGTMDGLLSVWDGVSHQSLTNFIAHTRPISALAYSPDGQLLATASWDRQVVVRKVGKEREGGRTLAGHQDIVAGCRFAPGGKHLLSWSYDGTLRWWDLDSGVDVCVFKGHADRVTGAALSPDGRSVASVSRDGTLRLWDLAHQVEAGSANIGREARACFFLLDGESVLVVDDLGQMLLLGAPGFEIQAQLEVGCAVMCGALAPAGAQVALGCEDGRVRFVAVDGVENCPVVVPALSVIKPTATLLGRLTGKTRLARVFQWDCPVCRQSVEAAAVPSKPVPCRGCKRTLVVSQRELALV